MILVIDFGSQYTKLLAAKISLLNIRCVVISIDDFDPQKVKNINGIILSGGDGDPRSPPREHYSWNEFRGKIPILGICYGAQLIANQNGCYISSEKERSEFGKTKIRKTQKSILLKYPDDNYDISVCMSHNFSISRNDWNISTFLTSNDSQNVAGFQVDGQQCFGLQFHPEVESTPRGMEFLEQFCSVVCECETNWTRKCKIQETERYISEKINSKNGNILLALSGGVDSTTVAFLINRICPEKLFCVFVDTGFFRDEDRIVITGCFHSGIKISIVQRDCVSKLKNVFDPEQKRKILGQEFVDAFLKKKIALEKKFGPFSFLAQGTIYPDIIESKNIKSHHNVGGLPKELGGLELMEPLQNLFKNDVREIATQIGIPPEIVNRHPFPGPGLAIRIMGDISEENVNILRLADQIYISILKQEGIYDSIWQAGAILTDTKSTGVKGDKRAYGYVIALRAVVSVDGMTAEIYPIPFEILQKIANEITRIIPQVSRVVYDITGKPPATIEWS